MVWSHSSADPIPKLPEQHKLETLVREKKEKKEEEKWEEDGTESKIWIGRNGKVIIGGVAGCRT